MSPMPRWPLALALALAASASPAAAADAPITLRVDARESVRHLLHVTESVPVASGEVSLAYPKWIPGEHGPTGPIAEVVDLVVTAGGRRLEWRRDDVDMYVIHVHVPAGVTKLDLAFDFLLTDQRSGYSSASSATDELLVLSWNQVLFYPAGVPSDRVTVHASLLAPEGWSHGTALTGTPASGGTLDFAPCTLTHLVDSPVLLGRWFRTIDVSPPEGPHYVMDLACDGPAGLLVPDSALVGYRRLPAEAQAFFGGWHHHGYHFLVTLSDYTSHFGLEHHESSDDRVPERTFVDPERRLSSSTLLAHELSHSWNGKYRRPRGLATPDYGAPMKGELLWVYEGLTNYSGWVLAARSRIRTPEQARADLAHVAAELEQHRGRDWRPLVDTAVEAQVLYESRHEWQDRRRGTDFYNEGGLVWLDADVTIRRLTHGAKSLDDFCHLFHGGRGGPELVPYDFDDVVRALNAVAPYDWAGFLRERIERVQPQPPLGGLTGAGWELAWSDTMSEVMRATEDRDESLEESASIGVHLDKDGRITDVVPGSPADRAGLAPGNTLVAVDGRRWSREILRDAIRATRERHRLELTVWSQDELRTAHLEYSGGLRYPVLHRIPGTPDVLASIFAPHAMR